MSPVRTRTPGDLVSAGSVKGLVEMAAKFVIWEVSCLTTTPDQVGTRLRLRVKVVDKCSKSAADSIANHRVSDLSADRVRYVHRTTLRRTNHETDS
jgi:hypothetical protein